MTGLNLFGLRDGTRVAAPHSLELITSYVLSEQDDWFEEELPFVRTLLQEGQKVVDIGANFGVYTLAAARAVGRIGHVYAFEPATATATALEHSIRVNGFTNVSVLRQAVSSTPGPRWLKLNANAELNALSPVHVEAPDAEAVMATTLDAAMAQLKWSPIDFVKIDAEGEEQSIIQGGKRFFTEQSPVVLFEVRNGTEFHLDLADQFQGLGYRTYRLVPGLGLLVPFDRDQPPDGFLLNLFGCKADRAAGLAARGMLVDQDPDREQLELREIAARTCPGMQGWWDDAGSEMPYVRQFKSAWQAAPSNPGRYGLEKAISLYLQSRDVRTVPAQRVAALRAAFEHMLALCTTDGSRLRLSTLARIALAWGKRAVAAAALSRLASSPWTESQGLLEPFLVPCARYDFEVPPQPLSNWIRAAVFEGWEEAATFSSYFTPDESKARIAKLAQLKPLSPSMARRLELVSARQAAIAASSPASQLLARALAEQKAGRFPQASAMCDEILAMEPLHVRALHVKGVLAHQMGDSAAALNLISQAVDGDPAQPEFHVNLGVVLHSLGRPQEAVRSWQLALALDSDSWLAASNLGNVLRELGDAEAAVAYCRRALELRPDAPEPHCNLGVALAVLGRYSEAADSYQRAIELRPDYAEALHNFGNVCIDFGRYHAALEAFRAALTARPGYVSAFSNLLFCLNYDPTADPDVVAREHKQWDARFAAPLRRAAHRPKDGSPGRKLRIGYVSPDFREHSVSYFIAPVLREHNRDLFEVTCFAEVRRPDSVTARLRALSDRWVDTCGIGDVELEEQIRRDGIDILVDLAGHTNGNRLLVFARKPAPVQVSWLGYPHSTGLRAMDYRLVDEVTDPEGASDRRASERLVRLPSGFLCYEGPSDPPFPRIADPGRITLASFNNPSKISDPTLDVWAAVLRLLPSARLLLKGKAFSDPGHRVRVADAFQARGIGADRLDMRAMTADRREHLQLYSEVDIALDPFPYNGTTTTCEALWMGVPVVTLEGDRHAGRVGASILGRVGLGELVASDAGGYIDRVVALASQPGRLSEWRQSLRTRMSASELCDGPRITASIEAAYRRMWLDANSH